MRIVIAAIGKKRGGPETALVDDYLSRCKSMGRRIGFGDVTLAEADAPKALSGDALKQREGTLLLKAIPDGAQIIVLDERGENISSKKLAQLLGQMRDQGTGDVAFLIGGADGHGKEIKARAVRSISFGAATWPHMLVRAMLTEQIYRAMTILSGHPYHRS
ncbi:23S rRNA (pseudouridine(1915)-N(3))-methyltransferase RlmH [Hyphococcus lacteus]|uniref:Ribosomal RNA large subunit methyltransferase H n=1 Tax=Hyphococcus lacteus TaxID=3143536 RepID=A0ABV3Z2W3_9PROT